MRILIINQFFDPEPTFKGLVFAKELQKRGHEVEALTGFPHYPGGKLYKGYRVRLLQREEHDGVRVNRVAVYPSHDTSPLHRVMTYGSFALSAATLGPFITRRPDVVYVYHPPATIALAPMAQRYLRGVPFVYDVQDLWPDTLRATGLVQSELILRAVGVWCRWIYRAAERIVVLSPGFKEQIAALGVPRDKIDVIYNWCDEVAITKLDDAAAPPAPWDRDAFTVVFAGTMGLAQSLDTVLDAAALVANDERRIRFVFVGGGVERARLEGRAKTRGLTNVQFLEWRPMEHMGPILSAADALLVHLRDDPLFAITIPGKVQAYLASGRPILIGVRGDARTLVEEANAGLGFEPDNPTALAEAVRAMASRSIAEREAMGARGRRFYKSALSLSVGTDAFERTFERAIR